MRLFHLSGSGRKLEILPPSLVELGAHAVLAASAVAAAALNSAPIFVAGLIFYGVYNVVLRLSFSREAPDSYWEAWRKAKHLGWVSEEQFQAAVIAALQEDISDEQEPSEDWLLAGGFAPLEGSPPGLLTLGRLQTWHTGERRFWQVCSLNAQGEPDWASSWVEIIPLCLQPSTRAEARRLFTKLSVPFQEPPSA